MSASDCPHQRRPARCGPLRRFLRRWFLANSLLTGVFAVGWLVLRSGAKPSRLAYPCQQAAFSTASLAFGAPLVAALLALRRRLAAGLRSPAGLATAAIGLLATLGVWGYLSRLEAAPIPQPPRLSPPLEYRAQVFHLSDCPRDPFGDRFLCVEGMLSLMGQQGLKFYRSATVTPISGPDGIIAADDVVIIKINYQWSERGGTNTDLLRGLVRTIVDHVDGFTGEVVVAENAQFASTSNFDRAQNNAQDISLSPHDVVVHFQNLGYNVSHYDWTVIRNDEVSEYWQGDLQDGYVVYPYDPQLGGAVSYPKFQTGSGTYVSLKEGLWDPVGGYDREHLKLINVPVLKSHHAAYGVTACVKNNMGVVTGVLGTNSHNAIANGLLGALLGEIQPADLNILDAIWINANPNSGPATPYNQATRRDELVASTDPVAADIWATKYILIPAFLANGHSPPWPYPSADPDDPNSAFRQYLDNSMSRILAAGYEVTNDFAQIDVYSLALEIFSDGFESGNTWRWSSSVP